ncbi:MAG: Bcr/CflA family multidrug efflux MFS transporter [Gammaproteobacteria bacterium]|nr:Bcr/CflA family multidrug efflux MFS transporter [Gammaproteobacteria bacterium]
MINPTSFACTLSIALLVALGPLATDMYLPALPGLAGEFSTSAGMVQLTLSLFLAGFALAQIIYGPLSDRFGRKPVLLCGLALFVVASIACAFAKNIEMLILARFVQALGGSAGPVLGRAMVRDIHGPQESARVLSHIGSAMALAPAFAPILGGYMSVYLGWPSIFWFLTLVGILGASLLVLAIAETAPQEHRHPKPVKTILADYARLLQDATYLGYTLTCTLAYAGLFAFLSGSSFVIIDYFGVSEQHFGLLFMLVVAGYISGTLTGAKLSRSYDFRRLVAAGSVLLLIAGATMFIIALNQPEQVMSIILPMMIFMHGVGLVMPQSMAGAMANYPQMAGSASGLLGFIQMSVAGLIGIAVGHGYDGTPVAMALAIALMGLLSLLTYLLLLHRRPGPRAE